MNEIKFPVKIEVTDLKIDYAIGRDDLGRFIRLLVYDDPSLIALRDKLNEILPPRELMGESFMTGWNSRGDKENELKKPI